MNAHTVRIAAPAAMRREVSRLSTAEYARRFVHMSAATPAASAVNSQACSRRLTQPGDSRSVPIICRRTISA
jgi:hypothetical protein